ncbi:MAG TPA: DNA internalization-related competence protein ComEC/Rec2 [Gemmatimonadales bacterium]
MRPPILWIAAAFGLGLAAGLASFAGAWDVGAWGVGGPVLVGAALVYRRAPLGAALGMVAVAGLVWGTAAVAERARTCAGIWGSRERGAVDDGAVMSRAATVRLFDPAPASGGLVDARVVGGSCGGMLRLRWPEVRPARGGTTWVVAGRWLGNADRGVLVVRRAKELDPVPRGRGAARDRIAAKSAELFGSRAALVDALVIGRRAELDAKVRERYTRSGLAHLLSISGLHVGFLAAWLALGLKWLRVSRRARFAASSVMVLAYIWMLGWPAPAARAGLMLLLDGVGRLRQRVVAPRGTIGLAALVLLLVDPWAIRSVGAWLSVVAVAAVIWGSRAVSEGPLALRLLVPSVAATLLTAPITAFAFGTVAPVGIALNLVAIPLSSVVVPGLALALACSVVVEGVGTLLAAGSGLGLALLDTVAAFGAALPGGHVVHVPGWSAALLWAGIALVVWWLWNSPRRPWLIAARLGLVCAVLSWTLLLDASSLDACRCLTVHFLDVGQGDAAALRTPAGQWVVIDGGPRFGGRDAGRTVLVPFLRRRGVEELVAVVATHGHADHVGGLPAVLEAFPPKLVLEPGEPLGDASYLGFLAAVQASGATWQRVRTGDRIDVDGVTLHVLSPDSAWAVQTMDPNEESVVLLVQYGRSRVVFTGDAGVPVEGRLAGRVGDVDVLKIGHHGSRSATSSAWLVELAPEVAVVSVGAGNRYGHPAPEVLERLAGRGVQVYRTDRQGTITITLDGISATADVSRHD